MARRPLGVLALAAIGGCGFATDYAGTAYRCDVEDGRCPGGTSCVEGACRPPCRSSRVADGGFEGGTGSWSPDRATLTLSEGGHDSDHALEVCASESSDRFFVQATAIPVEAIDVGIPLQIGAWVRSPDTPDLRCQV